MDNSWPWTARSEAFQNPTAVFTVWMAVYQAAVWNRGCESYKGYLNPYTNSESETHCECLQERLQLLWEYFYLP